MVYLGSASELTLPTERHLSKDSQSVCEVIRKYCKATLTKEYCTHVYNNYFKKPTQHLFEINKSRYLIFVTHGY